MREIKYRQKLKPAYAKFCGEFHYWGFIDGAFHSPTGKNEACGESEQYAGLKDKNGVEIYNGDILRFEDKWEWYRLPFLSANEINEILNNHEKYPYEQRLVELPESYEWLLSYEIQSFWAVIGNIHENPELLEKNND